MISYVTCGVRVLGLSDTIGNLRGLHTENGKSVTRSVSSPGQIQGGMVASQSCYPHDDLFPRNRANQTFWHIFTFLDLDFVLNGNEHEP